MLSASEIWRLGLAPAIRRVTGRKRRQSSVGDGDDEDGIHSKVPALVCFDRVRVLSLRLAMRYEGEQREHRAYNVLTVSRRLVDLLSS
jgi:hypothetical protein